MERYLTMTKFNKIFNKLLKEERTEGIQSLPGKVIKALGNDWQILNMATRGVNVLQKSTECVMLPAEENTGTENASKEPPTTTGDSDVTKIPKGSFIFTSDDTNKLSSRAFNKKIPDVTVETQPGAWQFVGDQYNINPEIVILSYREIMAENLFSLIPPSNIFKSHDEFLTKTNSKKDEIPYRGSVRNASNKELFQVYAMTNIWDKSPKGSKNFGRYCYIVLNDKDGIEIYDSIKNDSVVPLLYAGSGKKYKDKEGIYEPKSIFFLSKASAEKLATEAYNDTSVCLIMIRGKDTSWVKQPSEGNIKIVSISVPMPTPPKATKEKETDQQQPVAKETPTEAVSTQQQSTTPDPAPNIPTVEPTIESIKKDLFNYIKENVKINILDEEETTPSTTNQETPPSTDNEPTANQNDQTTGKTLNYTLIGPILIGNIEFRTLMDNCKKVKVKTFTGKAGEILFDDVGKPLTLQALGFFTGVDDSKITSQAMDPSRAIKAVSGRVSDIYKKIS